MIAGGSWFWFGFLDWFVWGFFGFVRGGFFLKWLMLLLIFTGIPLESYLFVKQL